MEVAIIIIFVLVLLMIIFGSIKVLPEYERLVVLRLGKFAALLRLNRAGDSKKTKEAEIFFHGCSIKM